MFTTQATIERRAAKEKRLAEIEERLDTLEERTVVDVSPLEVRVAALESQPDAKPVDLSSVENRLTVLESAKPVDLTPLDERIAALESRSDESSEMRKRLEQAEINMAALRKELDELKAAAKKPTGFTTASTATKTTPSFILPSKKKTDDDTTA